MAPTRALRLFLMLSWTAVVVPSLPAQDFYQFERSFGTLGSGNLQFNTPRGITIDRTGRIIVSDTANHRVQVFDSDCNFLFSIGGLTTPGAIVTDSTDRIIVGEFVGRNVRVFSSTGAHLFDFPNAGPGGVVDAPRGLAVDSSGRIFVSVFGGSDDGIKAFDGLGNFLFKFPNAFGSGSDLHFDHLGRILFTDGQNQRISIFDPSGNFIGCFPNPDCSPGPFNGPEGVTVNNSNRIIVVEVVGNRVQVFDSSGTFISAFGTFGSGTGEFNQPSAISHDATTGRIAIADALNHRIQLFRPLPPVEVAIDIKPGSYPNTINVGSGGTVPIAIFSTLTFDATLVDPASVTLASAPVKMRGQGSRMASVEDVNNDGLLDLVIHVVTESLDLTQNDTEAVLTGRVPGGPSIRGVDTVRVIQ